VDLDTNIYENKGKKAHIDLHNKISHIEAILHT